MTYAIAGPPESADWRPSDHLDLQRPQRMELTPGHDRIRAVLTLCVQMVSLPRSIHVSSRPTRNATSSAPLNFWQPRRCQHPQGPSKGRRPPKQSIIQQLFSEGYRDPVHKLRIRETLRRYVKRRKCLAGVRAQGAFTPKTIALRVRRHQSVRFCRTTSRDSATTASDSHRHLHSTLCCCQPRVFPSGKSVDSPRSRHSSNSVSNSARAAATSRRASLPRTR